MNQKIIDQKKVHIGVQLSITQTGLGISLSQLKKESGLNADQIKGIMDGTAKYRIDSLLAICGSLEVDLFDLKNADGESI